MAASMEEDVDEIVSNVMCKIELTVTSGFEQVALNETLEKLQCEGKIRRGRITVNMQIEDVPKVLNLKCVENCYILMKEIKPFPFSENELENMKLLRELVRDVDWDKGIKAWGKIHSFPHPIASVPSVVPVDLGEPYSTKRINKPVKGDNQVPAKNPGKRKNKWDAKHKKNKKKSQQGNDHDAGDQDGTNLEKVSNQNTCTSAASELMSDKDQQVVEPLTKNASGDADDETSGASEIVDSVQSSKPEEAKKPRIKLTSFDPSMPTFRVTCKREGLHNFDSMGAAANFGGAINNYFNWNVDMKKFEFEVMLMIDNNEVRVLLALTYSSLYKRNITTYGRTTLRPTIAHSMLRLCDIQPYDVVCDPMCGTGSIPLEAALNWTRSIHLGGDIHHKDLTRAQENIQNYTSNLDDRGSKLVQPAVDLLHWDVTKLPLKTSSIDVFITDLPFGVRMGSKFQNWKLYPKAVEEMARVCRPGTGRLCLLTEDAKCITKTFHIMSKYWTKKTSIGINLGGLAAGVHLLLRNKEAFDHANRYIPIKDMKDKPGSKDSEVSSIESTTEMEGCLKSDTNT